MSASEIKSPTVPLLAQWDGPLRHTAGLFQLADGVTIPGGWEPAPGSYDPKAIPTPFARAEAMRLVLQNLDRALGHQLLDRFRELLLGVAAGLLDVDPDDLASSDYDNLGRALLTVDPHARYLAHLRFNAGDRRRSFGISYRTALFSPHARRLTSEWGELASAITPREQKALEVLADWREVLRRAERWDPTLAECEWQRGVDWVLRDKQPSPDLQTLREHARLVGPVWLSLPTGRAEEPVAQEPVYLPAVATGHADRVVALAHFQPRVTGDGVVLLDAKERPAATIAMPKAGDGRDLVASGMGMLKFGEGPLDHGAKRQLWVTGRDGRVGLVEALQPLQVALGKHGRRLDHDAVGACPALYPDIVRILCDRGLWPSAAGGTTLAFTSRTTEALQHSGRVPRADAIREQGGEVAHLGSDKQRRTIAFIDQLGERTIGDLRAIGFVLWSVFTGDAASQPQAGNRLAFSDGTLAFETGSDNPLEPKEHVYEIVLEAAPDAFRARLATLQRFSLAYAEPKGELGSVLAAAASSFVRWAAGRTDVLKIGRPAKQFDELRLTTGEVLKLALDSVDRPERR